MKRPALVLLVFVPAAAVLITIGLLLCVLSRSGTVVAGNPGPVAPLTRAIEIETLILVVASVSFRLLQFRQPSDGVGAAKCGPATLAERRASGLKYGWVDAAVAATFLTCLAFDASTLWRDHTRLATQRGLIANAAVHQAEYSAAVNVAAAYVAAHPHATLPELQHMNQLDAETIRLGGRQNTLVAGVIAAGPVHSASHDLPLWGLILMPTLWAARWGWGRKRRLERLRSGLCVRCGYDLRATVGRCPECGAVPPDLQRFPDLRSL